MKKTFRILSAFLAVVLLVGCFVSCGNNTSDSEDTKADNPNKSDVTGTTDPEESEASGTFLLSSYRATSRRFGDEWDIDIACDSDNSSEVSGGSL